CLASRGVQDIRRPDRRNAHSVCYRDAHWRCRAVDRSARLFDRSASGGAADHRGGPVAAPLFEAVPRLERIAVMEKLRWSTHWLPFYAAVAMRRWDLVVDLRGSALAWLLRADERRVMAKGDADEHRVRQLGRLFDLEPPPSPRLWTAPHHETAAAALIPLDGPILAIGPAANWRGKQWRGERFAELAQRL